jgi:hypothetical protein
MDCCCAKHAQCVIPGYWGLVDLVRGIALAGGIGWEVGVEKFQDACTELNFRL